MAKPPIVQKGRPHIVDVDPTLLSEEVKQQLRIKARERVNQERQEAAMDAFLAKEVALARHAHMPQEELKYISLDMAGHADRIMLDGVIYFHGQTYEVPKRIYDVLREVVGRGWDHEDEIGGANRDLYRRPRSTALLPGMETVAASQIFAGGR